MKHNKWKLAEKTYLHSKVKSGRNWNRCRVDADWQTERGPPRTGQSGGVSPTYPPGWDPLHVWDSWRGWSPRFGSRIIIMYGHRSTLRSDGRTETFSSSWSGEGKGCTERPRQQLFGWVLVGRRRRTLFDGWDRTISSIIRIS